ncbi:MAG: formylglycine-generating enzyme family protein [Chloroflexota bacterium]
MEKSIWGNIEFVKVSAGSFLMGSEHNELFGSYEMPQHSVNIPYDYWIARFPVSNGQYVVNMRSHPVSNWEEKRDHPIVGITWQKAMACCKELNNLLEDVIPQGLILRLPTESEWERAARGVDGRKWPWGNEFDKNNCNSAEGHKGDTTPIGLYSPRGDSPCGCADMAGNVWEWCHSFYKDYPYQINDGRENEKLDFVGHALRGGSFYFDSNYARCAARIRGDPSYDGKYCGFRVVVSIPLS